MFKYQLQDNLQLFPLSRAAFSTPPTHEHGRTTQPSDAASRIATTLEMSNDGAHHLILDAPRPSGTGLRSVGLCPEPRAAGMTATLCDPSS